MSAAELEGKSREELLALARSYKWWHSIDLGEMVTEGVTGRWALTERAFDRLEFAGRKVLDIGCFDGIWSFEAEKRGAREVYAVDLVSMRHSSEEPTFQVAHKLLGSKVRYYPNLSIYDVGRLGVTDFDIVIFCGLYYHLQHPLQALEALRAVMAEGGHLIVEGPALDLTDRVFADFHARTWFAGDPTNWWIPSMACLREWLDTTFFDVEAEWSGNRNFAPPPASHAAGAPTAPPLPLSRRIRALFAPEPSAPAATAPVAQDRVSLVARATSPAERLTRRILRHPLPPLASAPGVTGEAAASFADAATKYEQAAPWTRVRPDRTIAVACPAFAKDPLFLAVLGDRTADRGLAIFFHRPGLSLTLQGALLGELVTWPGFVAALFPGPRPERGPGVEAVMNEGHGYTQAPPDTVRRPGARELLLLEACLRAVPAFVARHAENPHGTEDVTLAVAAGALALTLSWIVEGEREL
jgi:tRNA (mo5U34)-methyltransferase